MGRRRLDAAGDADLSQAAAIDRCDGCGLIVEGGTEGCQAIFDAESARAYRDARFALRRRMIVDVYSLQHPDRYCVSAISLAAHLTGVCVAIERPEQADALNVAVQHWLSRRPRLEKPELPLARGILTIAAIQAASEPEAHARIAAEWAAATWAAYRDLQATARTWISLATRGGRI